MSEGMYYTMGLKTGGFLNPLAGAQSAVAAFRSSITSMMAKAALIAAPVVGAAGAFGLLKKAVTSAADMESTQAAFRTLVGDTAKAQQTLAQIEQMGAETPFEFPELADSGRKLIAFGEDSSTVVDVLRRIGDVSSGIQAPIGEIAEIYGKARVQGTLFAEDINQLTGRGIPIIQQFATILGVSQAQVKELASEGKITFPMLEQAFINLTAAGGQFHGMMQQQSSTTNGLMSTLTDGVNKLFRVIGAPINDFLRPMLSEGISLTDRLGSGMAAYIKLMSAARSQGKLGELVGTSLQVAAKETVNTLFSGAERLTAYLGTAFPLIAKTFGSELTSDRTEVFFKSLFNGLGNILRSHIESAIASLFSGLELDAKAADMSAASKQSDQRAGIYLGAAKAAISGGDLGQTLTEIATGIQAANEAGKKAAEAAKSSPVFDTTEDRAKLSGIGKALDPKAWDDLVTAWRGSGIAAAKAAEDSGKKAAVGLVEAIDAAKAVAKEDADKAGGPIKKVTTMLATNEPEQRRRIRLNDAADSFINRLNRRSEADRNKAPSNTDKLALADFWRRKARQERLQEGLKGIQRRGSQVGRPAREAAPVRDTAVDPLNRIFQVLSKIDGKLGGLETA